MKFEKCLINISWCYPLVLMHRLDLYCNEHSRTAPQDKITIEFCGLFGLKEEHLPKHEEL